MNGPGWIPQTEIQAWQANHGVRLRPWEVRLLTALDQVWMKHFHEGQAAQASRPPKTPSKRR